ncbi:MAG: M20/M25/M40 family metallo-hydrolase [Actinomycetota bacterium]|nr:M20/M25/M40 family metallo-hydrolase [Actinomycetota bacterium]
MSAVARATDAERDRLLADFTRLCEIESPSGHERHLADAVSAELREMGLEVHEDGSGPLTGSDAGNLFTRVPGTGAASLLLCAHLDTVPLGGPVEVVHEEGVLRNRHEAVLGADNKAAVATILGAARRLAGEEGPVGVELLFTTVEENGLRGAKAFDRSRLRSEMGFVFDHASPVGELIVAAPTYQRVEARFRGVAAHAGIRPEDGRSAITAAARFVSSLELGRLDDETTTNAGLIRGGSAANVVAEHCLVELEARSLDHERATEVVAGMVDAATEAASDLECDLETTVEELFRGYRLRRTAPPVDTAARALESLGIEARPAATGGGSDANALIAAGLPTVNVANGTERNHQPDESVTVDALETMLDVTLAIVEEAAR